MCRIEPEKRKVFATLLLIFLFAIVGCGDRSIHNGDLTISSTPAGLPENFPAELMYPETRVELLGELDTQGFWSPAQYALSFRTKDEGGQVHAYYMALLRRDRWQILQSRHFDDRKKTVVVAESPVKRIITLVISDGSPSVVQLYLKRTADD